MRYYEAALLITLLALICMFLSLKNANGAERDYQEPWCEQHEGIIEHVLKDRTRIDCLLDTYAIEFDYARKWAEAIGQAMLYGYRTDRKPGIALIMETEKDCVYLHRLREALFYGGIGATVWEVGDYAYQCSPEL